MQFSKSGYHLPTPTKIKKVANAILAGVIFAGTSAALNGHPVVGTVIFVIGFVAKTVSNFFSDDKPTSDEI